MKLYSDEVMESVREKLNHLEQQINWLKEQQNENYNTRRDSWALSDDEMEDTHGGGVVRDIIDRGIRYIKLGGSVNLNFGAWTVISGDDSPYISTMKSKQNVLKIYGRMQGRSNIIITLCKYVNGRKIYKNLGYEFIVR